MEKENFICQTEQHFKDNGNKEKLMELANFFGQMEKNTKEDGKII